MESSPSPQPERARPYPDPLVWIGAFVVLAIFCIVFGWLTYGQQPAQNPLLEENGPLETVQMLLVVATLLLFVARALRTNDIVAAICLPIVFGLFYTVMREVPRCDSGSYTGGVCIDAPVKYAFIVAVGLACAALGYLRRVRPIEMIRIENARPFWPLWLSAAAVGLAEIAESPVLIGTEESLELVGYGYCCALAFWIVRRT